MKDDYLWDKSGEPDREVARLEGLLGRYRYSGEPVPARRGAHLPWLAGGLVAAAAAILLLVWRPWAPPAGYRVFESGAVWVARAGDVIAPEGDSARVEIASLGEVRVEHGSALRCVDTGAETHAFYLQRGEISARVISEPRLFQIDSPNGLTVDLGCAYTLRVTDDGRSLLAVTEGQVELGLGERVVYVPAGASAESTPGRGPTPPVFDDALPELKDLARKLAATGEYAGGATKLADGYDPAWLARYLELAEDRDDALPLFALMADQGLPDELRGGIFDTLSTWDSTPEGVTKARVLAGDVEALGVLLEQWKRWWRRP